ncbi:MAG: hypothetical protein LBE09_09320 [Christensenellaceae bacterium]|nr:hypothetical protein [Christensenellaceae bacterium]
MATLSNYFVGNAKIMPKVQITLPKDIRKILGVDTRVTGLRSYARATGW